MNKRKNEDDITNNQNFNYKIYVDARSPSIILSGSENYTESNTDIDNKIEEYLKSGHIVFLMNFNAHRGYIFHPIISHSKKTLEQIGGFVMEITIIPSDHSPMQNIFIIEKEDSPFIYPMKNIEHFMTTKLTSDSDLLNLGNDYEKMGVLSLYRLKLKAKNIFNFSETIFSFNLIESTTLDISPLILQIN
jgi:hypothetical protein